LKNALQIFKIQPLLGNDARKIFLYGNPQLNKTVQGNVFSGKYVFEEMVYGDMVHGEMVRGIMVHG
jgi:hypothetical protein